MPDILVSKTVEDIVASEHKRTEDSALVARARSDEIASNSGLTIHAEILKGVFDHFRSQCVSRDRVHSLIFAEAGIAGEFHAGGTPVGPIKQHAAKTGVGLVIQGAYGRSRWSEFILGGATRDMLRDNAWPVLMSY